ncbi:MAG: AAA family ATPase, partial [Hungatella sp.]
MLIRINVGNYLSFNEVQEFSMLAGKVRNKSDRLYTDDSIKLLKFAAIFGANASGKSNLISAMNFVQRMVVKGFPKDVMWKYCKLNDANKEKPSYFEFEIKLNDKYYSYGFEAILSKQVVITEWLFEMCPSGQ